MVTRTRVGIRLGMALVVLLSLTGCEWTMLGGGASRSGLNPGENILSTSNVAGLQVQWSAPIVDSSLGAGWLQGSPVVANGTVYAATPDGRLFAFATKDGAPRWHAPVAVGTGSSTPAVSGGLVYVPNRAGVLTAFSATTGAVVWAAKVGTVEMSSPAVANGLVYVGGDHQTLYAYNATTGAKVWSVTAGTQVRAINNSPAVAGPNVYVTVNDDDYSDTTVKVPSVLNAYDALTGASRWSTTAPWDAGASRSAPAVADGRVFLASDVPTAYNATTGAVLWSHPLPDHNDSDFTTVAAAANGAAFFSVPGAGLFSLDATTGAQRWRVTEAWSSPVVANGVVYAIMNRTPQGQGPTAFAASDGRFLFHDYPSAWDTVGTPPVAVADGHIYVGGVDGVMAYGLAP